MVNINRKMDWIKLIIALVLGSIMCCIQTVHTGQTDRKAVSANHENEVMGDNITAAFEIKAKMPCTLLNITPPYACNTKCASIIEMERCIQYSLNCCKCSDENDQDKMFCLVNYTSMTADALDLTNITKQLNADNTTKVQFIINNTWQGYYPFFPLPFNITSISKLKNLLSLEICSCFVQFLQPFPLMFHNSTFSQISKIQNLSFTFALFHPNMSLVVRHLSNLRVLDLSSSRDMGMTMIKDTIASLNAELIEVLKLKNFQLVGAFNYDGSLNIRKFFSDKTYPNLRELDLSQNALYRIITGHKYGISTLAPNLKKLDISDNMLLDSHNSAFFFESWMHPQLVDFNMGYQGTSHRQFSVSEHVSTTFHDELHQQLNQANGFDISHWSRFRVRGIAYMLDCVNRYVNYTSGNSNISAIVSFNESNKHESERIQLMQYHLLHCLLPIQFAEGPPWGSLPFFKDIANTTCVLLMNIPLGKNLEVLSINNLHFEDSDPVAAKYEGDFCIGENNLKQLIFKDNSAWIKAIKLDYTLNNINSISGLHTLEVLDITGNALKINISTINNGSSFPNLRNLSVSGNNIAMDKNISFCKHQKQLSVIDLSYNQLGEKGMLSKYMIENCSHLQTLDLSGNKLTVHNLESFNLNGVQNFSLLNLSNNRFRNLPVAFLEDLASHGNGSRPLLINLDGNDLSCGCNEQDFAFISWIVEYFAMHTHNATLKIMNRNSLTCVGINGVNSISSFNTDSLKKMQDACHPSNLMTIINAIVGATGMLIFIMICTLLYNFRWRIKYVLFTIQKKVNDLAIPKEDREEKSVHIYDAFVSYCAEDRFWVHDVLMKRMEETYGFKLCIHYRDFPVGASIAETIISCMLESREIIIVLSDVALSSEWCRFELDQAILQSERTNKRVVVMSMGKLKNLSENPTAAHLMDTHNYLEWSEHPTGQKLFWAKLVGHMYNDTGCCVRCLPYGSKSIKYRDIHDSNDEHI